MTVTIHRDNSVTVVDNGRGIPVATMTKEGRPAVEDKIVEINPPGRLVTTFEPKWLPAEQAGAASTVVWEISGGGQPVLPRQFHQPPDVPDHLAG